MFYRRRELRRLWEVEVYDGDPNDPDVKTSKGTVVAWNAVDAIRHAGGPVAKQPKALHFVTWSDNAEAGIYRINNTTDGPVGDPLTPSIDRPDVPEEDWK